MKHLLITTMFIAFFGMTLTSCKETHKESTETATEMVYQCPMKCEGDKTYTDKDTKCPVCGMDLKPVEDSHTGHDH